MNVVFVNQYPFSYLGGVELHIRNLAHALLKRGAKVSLLCRRHSPSEGWQPESSGIEVIEVAGFLEMFSYLKGRRGEIDVCHAHMARKPFALQGLVCARLLGIPTVFTPHCFYPSTTFPLRLLKFAYDTTFTRGTLALAQRVVNLTPCDQRDAMVFGMPRAKSRIIPNSIHVSALQQGRADGFKKKYGIPGDFLLYVGRFAQAKCVDFLVRNHVAFNDVNLVLVGQDDGCLASILALASSLGLSSRVFALQKIPFEDLCAAYKEARGLVMASIYEGLPTVILEAGVFGTPTIAPHVGGIPYMSAVDVSLYRWNDDAGYRLCVRKLLSREPGKDEKQILHLAEQYDWENNSAKIMELYHELRRERRTSPGLAVSDTMKRGAD